MSRSTVHALLLVTGFLISLSMTVWAAPGGQDGSKKQDEPSQGSRHPIIYVMPNAVSSPDSTDNSRVIVDSSHNGKEPQVAKIYQELQRRSECQTFSENMIKEKADYFLLLQHGGGRGNRWAVSDKNGDVIASGESMVLGNSVKDACLAINRHWQKNVVTKGN